MLQKLTPPKQNKSYSRHRIYTVEAENIRLNKRLNEIKYSKHTKLKRTINDSIKVEKKLYNDQIHRSNIRRYRLSLLQEEN